MKKLTLIAAVVIAALSAKAAFLDWNVPATSAQTGFKVYLLTSLASSYANEQAIAEAALDSATVADLGRGKYGTPVKNATIGSADDAASMYAIVVDPSDSNNYTVKSLGNLSSLVYDPSQQQSSPGAYNTSDVSSLISGGTKTAYQAVPEPTTVALLALGLAALGLKRKVA